MQRLSVTEAMLERQEGVHTMSDTRADPPTNRQASAGGSRNAATADAQSQMIPMVTRTVDSEAVHLDSAQGKTVIAEGVVAKIAGVAAREIDGVHELVPMGATAALAGFAGRLARTDQRATGVNVEVGQREAAVDLNLTVDYGVNIPQLAEAVRQNIIERIRAMTGLIVKEVNINAADLYFAEEQHVEQPRVQ
jgi:uncharacterized alkaline shock family protein YloU